MIKKWEITIPELSGDMVRRAYVYLPESYYKQPNRRYPVLYMWDGHNVFFDEDATYGKSWGMKEYMDATRKQIIIAAVECNYSPDHGRLREYSPFNFKEKSIGRIKGQGKESMEWLVHTFKPYIDRHFRTVPGRGATWIAGSSMGGLMSLYALMEYNHVFSRAAALSPSLWTAPKDVSNMIAKAKLRKNTVLYMDYGEEEMKNRTAMKAHFARTCAQLMEKDVLLTTRIIPGGTHCEASWEKQIPFFMNTLIYKK